MERAKTVRAEVALSRGDRVVVEQTAAVFFEGRVLAVEGDRLRVQTTTESDSINVVTSDVYRVSSVKSEQRAGHFAVCGKAGAEWIGCQVDHVEGPNVHVVDADKKSFILPAERVLAPTPVTELNLQRHFERARERASFVRALEQAGAPQAPESWRPTPRKRVVARRGSGWFSAKIREADDESVAVEWEPDQRTSELTLGEIIPEPPYGASLKRGDFVLLRPKINGQAWIPSKVIAVNGPALDVVNVSGSRRSISAREVIPLTRP